MAKLTKRAAEQLRAHLADRPLDELVELLVEQASRDAALKDRLLTEAASCRNPSL